MLFRSEALQATGVWCLNILKYFRVSESWWINGIVWTLTLLVIILLMKHWGTIRRFIAEVRTELFKANWLWDPKEKGFKKYKELVDSTLVVLVAMLLLSGYVALWDVVLGTVVGLLTGGGIKGGF